MPQQPAPRQARDGPARILIVEDEAIVAFVLSECALSMGFEVEVLADGLQAMERLRRGDVDVAILDLGIPGLSGDHLARQAREQDPRLTIVLVAGPPG
ncbi:MAG: response regulator [Candidatus Latescibacterota bacterium]